MVRISLYSRLHFQHHVLQAIRTVRDVKHVSSSLTEAVRWLEQWDRGDNKDAYFYLLRRCIKHKALPEGRRLHALIRQRRYDYDGFLGTLLIKFYGECNCLDEARSAYDSLPTSNSMLALNNLLEAYISNSQIEQARQLFDSVSRKDSKVWDTMISAYAQKGDMNEAKNLFKQAKEPGTELWATLIKGYSSIRRLDKARVIFRMAPGDERVWNAIIAAYTQNGDIKEARSLLNRMRNPSVPTCKLLLDAYLKSGHIADAEAVFNRITSVSEAPWSTMLAAYLETGRFSDAKHTFKMMPNKDSSSWNAMIRAHALRGELENASTLFEDMGKMRNLESWNLILEAYKQHGRAGDTYKIFRGMKERYVKPDKDSFTTLISGCYDLKEADRVLKEVEWSVFIRDVDINNELIRMYLRLEVLNGAESVFTKLEMKNAESWILMVSGFAKLGSYKEAVELLPRMVIEGFMPDNSVFESMVSACSQLEDAGKCFRCMISDYYLSPSLPMYVRMVELLKKPNEAEDLVNSMPFIPDRSVWTALLTVCDKAGDASRVKVAQRALSQMNYEVRARSSMYN